MKRSQIKRRPLADTVLASLEPETQEYRELYGDGLYFRVKPNGGKSWQLRYKKPGGSWAWLGLGGYPEVSAALAKTKAAEHRKVVSNGIDPLEQKRASKAALELSRTRTFRSAAAGWFQSKTDQGLAESTLKKMRIYLDKDILPALGDKLLDEITRNDCAKLQASIEARDAHNGESKNSQTRPVVANTVRLTFPLWLISFGNNLIASIHVSGRPSPIANRLGKNSIYNIQQQCQQE